MRELKDAVGDDVVLIADLCVDEYTDHGHCGIVGSDGRVDNDATVEIYQTVALAQAEAGADIVAPSGMMDGQVGAIRAALDEVGRTDVAIWRMPPSTRRPCTDRSATRSTCRSPTVATGATTNRIRAMPVRRWTSCAPMSARAPTWSWSNRR